MKTLFSTLAAFVMISCTDQTTPDPALVQTYADVIVVREKFGDSAVVAAKVDSILESRGRNKEGFEKDLRSMSVNPDLFKSFYDSVTKELKIRRDSLR